MGEHDLNEPQAEAVACHDGPLLIFAGAGSGKCVSPDTWVWSGGLRRFGEVFANRRKKIASGWGTKRIVGWHDDGERSGIRVELESGCSVDATTNHPLWVRRPDGFEGWVPVGELTTADYVACGRGQADWGTAKLRRSDAYLLGLVVADGCLGQRAHTLQIDKQRRVFVAIMPTLLRWRKQAGGASNREIVIHDSSPNHAYVQLYAKDWRAWLMNTFGYTAEYSENRAVPTRVLGGTRNTVRAFLRGLYDGDGYCDHVRGAGFSTASRVLAEQVHQLLLGLGVFARLRTKQTFCNGKKCLPAHVVEIRDLHAFDAAVGFTRYGLTKDVSFDAVLKRKRNTNIDIVPYVRDVCRRAAEIVGGPAWRRMSGRDYSIGRRQPSFGKLKYLADQLPRSPAKTEMLRLVTEHRAWSRIKSLTPSTAKRIDCEVAGSHSFIGNGIINHNTKALTYRTASLLRAGIEPHRILLVTFTNKAANEIKERLHGLVGDKAKRVWAGTFHSICARLLRSHAAEIHRRADFVIYDDSDQETVLKQIIGELQLDKKSWAPAVIAERIAKAKQNAWAPCDIPVLDAEVGTFLRIWERYEQWLASCNALDFEDLILVTMRLAEGGTPTGAALCSLFTHVMVDEFQDTNLTQYRFVKALARTRNLCVVGDDDQCIYSWRGADNQHIRDFSKTFPDAKVVKLEQNYRSTKRIVACALAVISQSKTRTDKALWTSNATGEKVQIVATDDERAEARFIVKRMRSLITSGRSPSEMAVLYRTHIQSRPIEDELRDQNVPYRIVGGHKFNDRKEVKDMHAFLRLITNPDSDVDILRVINVPSRGIGNTTTKRLGEIAGSRRTGLWDAIPVAVASDDLGRKERMQLHAFRDMIENFVKTSTAERPSDVAKRLVTGTGYKRMYELEAKEQETAGKYAEAKVSAERAANVDEVINAVASYESRASAEGDIPTLRGYVQAVSLAMQQDRDEDVTKVTLQTVHAAKGLEWPFVWMVGVEEGKFPGRSTDALQQEEERRLAYVCITRARERLWVTHAYQRYVRGQMESAGPSRYIGEMEEHAGDSVDRVDFDELEKREQEMRLRAQETRI